MEVLDDNVDLFRSALAKHRDRKWADQVLGGLTSSSFGGEFAFTSWYAGALTDLEAWVGSCDCDRHDELDGPCPRKGRLLHRAHSHATIKMDEMIDVASSWPPETFGGSWAFLQEITGKRE